MKAAPKLYRIQSRYETPESQSTKNLVRCLASYRDAGQQRKRPSKKTQQVPPAPDLPSPHLWYTHLSPKGFLSTTSFTLSMGSPLAGSRMRGDDSFSANSFS